MPVVVWIVTLVIEATFALALGAALGAVVGWSVLAVLWGVTAWGLLRATGRVAVSTTQLQVGRARLPLSATGRVTVLDADGARALRGPGADPRAYLWLKGWVPTAVRVEVDDASDPTPYWYVSTRHPQQLAAAIAQAKDGGSAVTR